MHGVLAQRELAVALDEDCLLAAGELIGRRDVANRAVQPDVIVVFDEAGNQLPCILQQVLAIKLRMASFSQALSQWSRGTSALCSFTLP